MQPRVRSLTPVLPTSSVVDTLKWYEERLGASDLWHWGAPVSHGGCLLGSAGMQFTLDPDLARAMYDAHMFISVANVVGFREQLAARNTKVENEPEAKPWGTVEFVVRDPNGLRLRFTEFAKPRESRSERLKVKIERRQLQYDELKRLYLSVDWGRFLLDASDVRPSLVTSVATYEGDVVGAASISGNGVDAFVIRDVMVHPRFQGQGIGTRLMEDLREWISSNVPKGAQVLLLTGTHTTTFYERLGFFGPDNGLVGMYLRP